MYMFSQYPTVTPSDSCLPSAHFYGHQISISLLKTQAGHVPPVHQQTGINSSDLFNTNKNQ